MRERLGIPYYNNSVNSSATAPARSVCTVGHRKNRGSDSTSCSLKKQKRLGAAMCITSSRSNKLVEIDLPTKTHHDSKPTTAAPIAWEKLTF